MNADSRQVTLHIGLPKTATTTIQRHLYKNADHLRELGIDYCPDLCGTPFTKKIVAHHAIARVCRKRRGINLPAESRDLVRRRLSHPGQYLLSSEWFSRANAEGVRALIDEFDLPDQRQVVFVTRSELAYIRSRWMQGIKTGKHADSLWEYYSTRYKRRRLQYSEKLKVWLDAGFSLTALRYEDLKTSSDLTVEFLRHLLDKDIDMAHWESLPNANISPNHDSVAHYQQFLAPIHKVIAPRVKQRKIVRWFTGAHNIFCRNKLIDRLGECKQYREDLERIKDDIVLLPNIDNLNYKKMQRCLSVGL